jgi:hypothetical protein
LRVVLTMALTLVSVVITCNNGKISQLGLLQVVYINFFKYNGLDMSKTLVELYVDAIVKSTANSKTNETSYDINSGVFYLSE